MISDKHLFSDSIFIGHMALGALLDAVETVYGPQYEDENGDPVPGSRLLAEMLIELAETNELQFKLITHNNGDAFEEYVLNDHVFRDHQANVIEHKLGELISKLEGLASLHATVINDSAKSATSHEGGDE